jgi:hypothetical protein
VSRNAKREHGLEIGAHPEVVEFSGIVARDLDERGVLRERRLRNRMIGGKQTVLGAKNTVSLFDVR